MQNLRKNIYRSLSLASKPSRSIHIINQARKRVQIQQQTRPKLLVQSQCRAFFNKQEPIDFDPKKDYYKVLEVKETASQSEIKNAYYRLCQYYHPDRNNGQFQDKFKDITSAYQVVGEEKKRKRYDALRMGQPDPAQTGGFNWNNAARGQPGAGFDQEKIKRDMENFWKQFNQGFSKFKKDFNDRASKGAPNYSQYTSKYSQFFKNNFKQASGKQMNLNDKKKLVHGLFLVFGSLMMLKLMFGGRHSRQQMYDQQQYMQQMQQGPYQGGGGGGGYPGGYEQMQPPPGYGGGRGQLPPGYPPQVGFLANQPQYQQQPQQMPQFYQPGGVGYPGNQPMAGGAYNQPGYSPRQ